MAGNWAEVHAGEGRTEKALQPAPVAASVRAPAPKPDKPKTTEQIIEDMRKVSGTNA